MVPSILKAQMTSVQGEVTYVSGNTYFVNIGKDAGAAQGDTLFSTNKKPLFVIESISRKSSSCKIINLDIKADVGMKVTAYVLQALAGQKPLKVFTRKDTITAVDNRQQILFGNIEKAQKDSSAGTSAIRYVAPSSNQIRGRIALQGLIMNDRITGANDYRQAGGLINFHVYRIQNSYFNTHVNARVRKTYSERHLTSDHYPMRVYEVSLEYNNPASAYTFTVGRVFSAEINGVGNFDGGTMGYQITDRLKIGAFGGTQPDYLNSKPTASHSKGGMYIHYQNESSAAWQWNGTLALTGQYVKGKIDREYFYVQNNVSYGPRLFAYMNSEIGINRSKLSSRKKTFELSNVYLLGRYQPFNPLTISLSYDARTNVFLLQSYRSIPDSLFDDAYRQGFRGDVHWRATRHLTLTFSSSVRTRSGDPNSTYLNSGSFYYHNLLKTKLNINYAIFFATTPFTKATSSSYGLSRQFSDVYLSTTYRTYRYEYVSQGTHYRRQSITFDGSYALTRKVFVTLEYENSSGKNEKSGRFFTELSYRF